MKLHGWMFGLSAVVLLIGSSAAQAQSTMQYEDRYDPFHFSHTKFDDHDRQMVRDWLELHRANPPEGARPEDKLSPELESRLRVDTLIDRDLRALMRPLPGDLERALDDPPPGYRYALIGENLVLVDEGLHARDIIHLDSVMQLVSQ
jgi:hypothetical protein